MKVQGLLDLLREVGGGGGAPAGGSGGHSGGMGGMKAGGPAPSGGQAAWNAGIRGSSVNNLGPIPSPVLGVVTADKASIYKRRKKKKKKHESLSPTKSEELMGLFKEPAISNEEKELAEAISAGNLQVWDKGPKFSEVERYTIAMHNDHGWNVYTMKDHHFGSKELELFFHTNQKLKDDKTWGSKLDYKKLPADVKSIIMAKGFKGEM